MTGSVPIGRRDLIAGGLACAAFADRLGARTHDAPALRIQRLAWAGIRLQLPGATLFIDPLIDPDIWGDALPDRLVAVDDGIGDCFVLLTHNHPDHRDPMAISSALSRGGVIAYPSGGSPLGGMGAHIRERPSPLWEPQLLGDFTATPVPASDGYGDAQVSWVVSAGGRRILHGGDTMMHGHWWRIGRQFGHFDAAFLPINGARFSWRLPASEEPAVLTPAQALTAATIIGARTLIPIHFGVRGAEGYAEMPRALEMLAQARTPNSPQVQILAPGQWLGWQEPRAEQM